MQSLGATSSPAHKSVHLIDHVYYPLWEEVPSVPRQNVYQPAIVPPKVLKALIVSYSMMAGVEILPAKT